MCQSSVSHSPRRPAGRRSGRVNVVLIGAIACALLMGTLFLLMGQESMSTVGIRFMSALARRDAKTLASISHIEGKTSDDLVKEWQRTLDRAKNFRFKWQILGSEEAGPDSGSVRLEVERNEEGYGNKYQLPLRRDGDRWKVEVRGISREMYPYLPR